MVSKPKVVEMVKMAQQMQREQLAASAAAGGSSLAVGAAAAAATSAPPAAPSMHAGMKRPMENAGYDAQAEALKRQRAGGLAEGYAAAAASAEAGGSGSMLAAGAAAAAAATAPTEDLDADRGEDLASKADVLVQAGVDVDAEAEEAAIEAREGGDDEGAVFGGARLQLKMEEICAKFGLTPDHAASHFVAVALHERMSQLVESLRGAARQRTNAAKLAFGPQGFARSTDPKQSWKQQQAAAAKRKAEREAGSGSGSGDAPAVAATPRGGTIAVTPADVLYVLDGERASNRSRVVQWWHCNQTPLGDYAKQSARLFPPPTKPPAEKPGP